MPLFIGVSNICKAGVLTKGFLRCIFGGTKGKYRSLKKLNNATH